MSKDKIAQEENTFPEEGPRHLFEPHLPHL